MELLPFSLIEFSGPERNEFLHRLLSNDLKIASGQQTTAYLLDVGGKPQAFFWIYQSSDKTHLCCPSIVAGKALEEFEKMHFGEKLAFRSVPLNPSLLEAPQGALSFELFGLAKRYWLSWSEQASQVPAGFVWERQRILSSLAWPSDWDEKTLMLEVCRTTDYLDGKGCYPGQEVVARTLHRGRVNRRFIALRGTRGTVNPGDPLCFGEKTVGRVSSSWQDEEELRVLGFLRREHCQLGQQVQCRDLALEVIDSPLLSEVS